MLFEIGKRYLFMTQRYAWVGTVEHLTPTHVKLGKDAEVIYDDIGPFEGWSSGKTPGQRGKVPGQVVCTLGCDATPVP